MKKGFTLIELLVVVLIIGILSAIALPQYTKAVEKSRGTQALILLKALDQAQEAYHLANGTYANDFAELDVSVPWSGSSTSVSNGQWSISLYNDNGTGYQANRIYATRLSGPYANCGFAIMYDTLPSWGTKLICAEPKNRPTSGDWCQKLFSGTKLSGEDNDYYWKIPY